MMKDLELSPSSFLLTHSHTPRTLHDLPPHTHELYLQLNSAYTEPLAMTSIRITRLPRLLSRRAFSTSTARTTSFKSGPAPPRLPKEDQEVFEKLQKQSTGAFSQPKTVSASSSDVRSRINQADSSTSAGSRMQVNQSPDSSAPEIKEGEEFHPNMRRGAKPEFEGDVNPKTGEVGGPKNDPLRWKGDWSYNGRVTDF
jgi:hypothetical protein